MVPRAVPIALPPQSFVLEFPLLTVNRLLLLQEPLPNYLAYAFRDLSVGKGLEPILRQLTVARFSE